MHRYSMAVPANELKQYQQPVSNGDAVPSAVDLNSWREPRNDPVPNLRPVVHEGWPIISLSIIMVNHCIKVKGGVLAKLAI